MFCRCLVFLLFKLAAYFVRNYGYQLILCKLMQASFALADDSDVRAYFGSWQAAIPHCDQATQLRRRKTTGTCIHLSEDGAVIHAHDLHDKPGSGKQMLMDMMLRGVVSEIRKQNKWKFRPISFLMVYAASGPVRNEPFPVLCFGKREAKTQPGLLVPNPFFVSPQWWDEYAATSLKQSATRPWKFRSRQVLFRGACGPGAHARFRLLRMLDPANLLNVGFTKVDGYNSMATCVRHLASKNDGSEADIVRIMKTRILPHVAPSNFSSYRYLLHMPGSATGSYSRNLQYLWTHGSVVFVWRHAASEWYYRHLRDGEHYLSVNETDLFETLRKLEEKPELRSALRKGSRDVQRDLLSGQALVARWLAIFSILQERQSHDPPKPAHSTSCTCDSALLSSSTFRPCKKCEITLKRGRSITKFVGLVPKTLPSAYVQHAT